MSAANRQNARPRASGIHHDDRTSDEFTGKLHQRIADGRLQIGR